MSFSFHSIGKPAAVAAYITAEINAITGDDAESVMKRSAYETLANVCKAQGPDVAVRASCHGAINTDANGAVADTFLKLEVEPMRGFKE